MKTPYIQYSKAHDYWHEFAGKKCEYTKFSERVKLGVPFERAILDEKLNRRKQPLTLEEKRKRMREYQRKYRSEEYKSKKSPHLL